MKSIVTAFALLLSGWCAANQAQPKQFRISLQLIEVPHPVLTELLGGEETGGPALHGKCLALAKEGRAKILDSSMVICRSGQRASLETIREEIYPTEASNEGLDAVRPPVTPKLLSRPFDGIFGGNFETRNTGATFEVEATTGLESRVIDLRFVHEFITPVRLETWMEDRDQFGDASIRMPVFGTWRVHTSLSVVPGKFELASVISPRPKAPVPAVSRKILVFVRADIVPVPVSP
jgi:hypothetical protein